MKTKITLFFSILFSIISYSQDKTFDLIKDKTETNILYDQVFGISNASKINTENITATYFMQVYHEMQRADNLARLPKLEVLKKASKMGFVENQIPLSVLICDFEKINSASFEKGDLILNSNQQFELKANSSAVFDKHSINLIGPLTSKSKSRTVNFVLNDDLTFNTTNRSIVSISFMDASSNSYKTITQNIPFSITFQENGKQTVWCKIVLNDGVTITESFTIDINANASMNKSSNVNLQPDAITSITASIPYQGFGESSPFFGVGEYDIFLDTVDGVLDKPIFLVDGFDPGDSRNIQALYSLLNYGAGQNLADTLRAQGFDIVLLNFPTYTRPNSTTVVDGGVDFIQRNAFILVTLINQINAQKVGNQKNVVIGPSMGGLISRYALRYMEMNNLNHDTRLFISFDSPHQGANVPIGFQHLFNYLAFGPVGNVAVQPVVNGLIKSPAARQMLIDHMEGHLQTDNAFEFNTNTNSLLPTGAPNYRTAFQNELNTMGFPVTTRNISISNGANNGTTNYTPDFEVMNYTLNISTSQRAIINLRYTPAANQTNQVSRFRGQQFLGFFWFTGFESLANSKAPTFTAGLDTAPGGRFDITGFSNGIGTDPILTQFFDNLNADYFTFIPTWSSMAVGNTNNLYTPITSSTTTPFAAYSIPTVNENHVTLNQDNVPFAITEIINGSLGNLNPVFDSIWIKNPIDTSIEINTSYTIENATISIIDLLGKTIYQTKNQTINGTLEIPVSLSKGVYLIKIGNESGSVTKKMVKN